ncbi:MAG: hypothetical protein OJF59_001524 [Cytophagales bacterium]|nr:hypothetical protein [Bacteroidota bacterium]MBS1980456.1 hypothetical protein [Bacteroidota bacterium]WHZ07771.1 MAG: hypothetical protein OJF59_001524 [Cytophagales bacterium]
MKKGVVLFVAALIMLGACASPKPYYETSIGKKKLKYFNSIQFGQKERPKVKF